MRRLPRRRRLVAPALALALLSGGACGVDRSRPAGAPDVTVAGSSSQPRTEDRQADPPDRASLGPARIRPVADWPFSNESPWNTPLDDAADLERGDAVRTDQVRWDWIPVEINAGRYSHPVYRASDDDPTVVVVDDGRDGLTSSVKMPPDARPADGEDRHLLVIDPSGSWVDEMWDARGSVVDGFVVGYHARTDLLGAGLGDGVRAYGGSAMGGLIRQWELERGEIRHALALALTDGQLASGPVWPATREDGNGTDTYGGAVPMGTLVAIPPDIDLSGLGLTAAGLTIATALQDFGAYVVDRAGAMVIYAEPTLEGTQLLDDARGDMESLRAMLSVVTDNRTGRTGGPGDRLAPPGPPPSQD